MNFNYLPFISLIWISLEQHLPGLAYCDSKKLLSFRANFHGQKCAQLFKKCRLDPYFSLDVKIIQMCKKYAHSTSISWTGISDNKNRSYALALTENSFRYESTQSFIHHHTCSFLSMVQHLTKCH